MYRYILTWLKYLGLSFTLTLSAVAWEEGSGAGKWIFIGTSILVAFIVLKLIIRLIVKLVSGLKFALKIRSIDFYFGEDKTLIAIKK